MDGSFNKRLGTKFAPLLPDLFLHAHEADCLQWLLQNKDRNLAQIFNSSVRCIDYVLSLNNSRFGDYLHRIYPKKLEVKDTIYTQMYASYLDLHFEIDNEERLKTKIYDKRDYFTFPIVNFPFISSNIPASPAYFHNSFVIIGLAHSTEIFRTELSSWRKTCSQKATLLLGGSHRYKICTAVITLWLPLTKYLKWQWIFYYLCRCFLSSITATTYRIWLCICHDLPDLTVYMSSTAMSYKKQELLILREHLSSSPVLCWGPCCSSL